MPFYKTIDREEKLYFKYDMYEIEGDVFLNSYIPYRKTYSIKEPEYKKILGMNIQTNKGVSFNFENLNGDLLKSVNVNIFYYLDKIKVNAPEILDVFNSTIAESLSNLEKMVGVLSGEDYIEAIKLTKPLILKLYKKSLKSVEELSEQKNELTNDFLVQLKKDIDLKMTFFDDLDI